MTWRFKIQNIAGGLLLLVVCFFGPFHITTAQGTSNQGSDSSAAQTTPPANTTPAAPTAATPGIPNLTYQPLVGIPGVSNAVTDFGTYINQLYFLAISLAALLAVIKIIIAGVKYMLTDIVPGKEAAKKDIWGSLLGLLLIISAVLILGTINPNLTNLNVLSGAPMLRTPANTEQYGPPAPPPTTSAAYANAQVQQVQQPNGTTVPQVTLAVSSTENATVGGQTTPVSVVSQTALNDLTAGIRALQVQCDSKTPRGTMVNTEGNIRIEGETRVRRSVTTAVCQ